LWQNICIERREPPHTADELHEQLRAEVSLSNIELFEDLALLYDEETIASLKENFAIRYRRAVGVFPDQRHIFADSLNRIVAGGRQSVADVIAILDRQFQPKGSSSAVDCG